LQNRRLEPGAAALRQRPGQARFQIEFASNTGKREHCPFRESDSAGCCCLYTINPSSRIRAFALRIKQQVRLIKSSVTGEIGRRTALRCAAPARAWSLKYPFRTIF